MADASNSNQTNTSSSNIDVNTPYIPRRPAPLISISVNHPIATAIRKVKNFLTHKQTLFSTSFTIKTTPIVAIVSLFGLANLFGGGITTAFTIGKTMEQKLLASMPSPSPKVIVTTPVPALSRITTVSRAGTIKATHQLLPGSVGSGDIPAVIQRQTSSLAAEFTPTIKPSLTPAPTTLHYLLITRSGSINYLSTETNIHLQNYVGLRVLITRSFNSSKNILTIAKPDDIEVLE